MCGCLLSAFALIGSSPNPLTPPAPTEPERHLHDLEFRLCSPSPPRRLGARSAVGGPFLQFRRAFMTDPRPCDHGKQEVTHMPEVFPGISMDPNVRFGNSCVTGTRVDVATIVAAIAEGEPFATVGDEYGLTVEQVRAASDTPPTSPRTRLRRSTRLREDSPRREHPASAPPSAQEPGLRQRAPCAGRARHDRRLHQDPAGG